ncbi:MAG: TIGR03862 family flavoprotein [Methylocystis sp.]
MLLAVLPALTRNTQISAPAPFCAVIGAGPAGLIAADVLSRAGARVTVFDHKPSPARKFLMAGRGGLNLTHSEPLEIFLTRYGAAAEWLEPIIRVFPPERFREFCAELGEETFIGTSGRVFPKSFKASPLLRALLTRLAAQGVRFERGAFEGFVGGNALSLGEPGDGSRELAPGAAILALGGASWPRLGSDGGWTRAFDALGVAMTPLAPANCGALIRWSEHFQGAFEGQPIKTILLRNSAATARGDVVVTRAGLEGGPAYALASSLRAEVERGGGASLSVDLRPDASVAELARKLERERGKQSLATFLRKTIKLAKIEMALLREASPLGLPRESEALAELIKNIPLRVMGVSGFERAISTSGGVRFDEAFSSPARCWISTRRPAAICCRRLFRQGSPRA